MQLNPLSADETNSSSSGVECEAPKEVTACPIETSERTPATTDASTTVSTCSGIQCSRTLLIISSPIIGGLIFLIVLLIILVAVSLCCFNRRRRGRFLLKVRGQQDYQLEDNPTYATAGKLNASCGILYSYSLLCGLPNPLMIIIV